MTTDHRALELIERLGNLLREEGRQGMSGALAPVHWQVLAYLSRCNRFSDHPVAVSEYLGLTKGTVSQSLKLLEARGLVARRPDPSDGRRVRLLLTASGLRAARAFPPAGAKAALAGLGARTQELEGLLHQLLQSLVRARGGRLFGACGACRHLVRAPSGLSCGLLDEPLTDHDLDRICREQEPSHPGAE